jgi:hypothetical protein
MRYYINKYVIPFVLRKQVIPLLRKAISLEWAFAHKQLHYFRYHITLSSSSAYTPVTPLPSLSYLAPTTQEWTTAAVKVLVTFKCDVPDVDESPDFGSISLGRLSFDFLFLEKKVGNIADMTVSCRRDLKD